jgi:hypothetical protein
MDKLQTSILSSLSMRLTIMKDSRLGTFRVCTEWTAELSPKRRVKVTQP